MLVRIYLKVFIGMFEVKDLYGLGEDLRVNSFVFEFSV